MSNENKANDGKNAKEPMDISIPFAAVIAVLILGLGVCGLLLYRTFNANARLERQVVENKLRQDKLQFDKQRADDEAKLALANNRRIDFLTQAQKSTNSIEPFIVRRLRIKENLASLSTNELGKRIALFPELVMEAERLFQVEEPSLPTQEEIVSKLEAARSVIAQMQNAAGTAFEPGPEMGSNLQSLGTWDE